MLEDVTASPRMATTTIWVAKLMAPFYIARPFRGTWKYEARGAAAFSTPAKARPRATREIYPEDPRSPGDKKEMWFADRWRQKKRATCSVRAAPAPARAASRAL